MAIKPVQLRSPSSGGGDWELAASRYMMGAHVCQCVGDRIWGLFLPLYLAELSPDSVAPVAVIEVARHLAGMLFSTSVADACERRGARTVLWLLLLCENAGVLLGAFCSTAAGGAFLSKPVFWLSAACFGVDAVCSDALRTLVGKVSVRALTGAVGGSKQAKGLLATTNAALVRLDMVVALATPVVVGACASKLGNVGAAKAFALLHVVGCFGVLGCATRFHATLDDHGKKLDDKPAAPARTPSGSAILGAKETLKRLSPFARGTMDCYCLLYFTVLSPHGVTIAWLRGVRRMDATLIGAFQTAAQAAGLAATYATPKLIAALGLPGAARGSNALQLGANALGVAALVSGRSAVFLGSLVVSRLGLWAFDLVEREVLQTAASGDEACLALFAEQNKRTSAASLLMFGASAVFSGAATFPYLIAASLANLFVASFLLNRGIAAPAKGEKRD